MPIDSTELAAIAAAYARSMTSIRGRRIQRLVMREFARYDLVVPATDADGAPVLIALQTSGRIAVLRSDGRGKTVSLAECESLQGAMVNTAFDLLKDSLPTVRWEVHHPGLAGGLSPLTIFASDLEETDLRAVGDVLRRQEK